MELMSLVIGVGRGIGQSMLIREYTMDLTCCTTLPVSRINAVKQFNSYCSSICGVLVWQMQINIFQQNKIGTFQQYRLILLIIIIRQQWTRISQLQGWFEQIFHTENLIIIYYQVTQQQQKPMFRIFKSKEYLKAYKLLESNNFFNYEFKNFKINAIVRQVIENHSLFNSLIQILNEVKLTPLRILKIQLLVQSLLQMDSKMEQNEQIFQLLHKLRAKVKQMAVHVSPLQNSSVGASHQNILSTKESQNQGEYIFQDGISFLMARVVEPLLQLQERLIFSYDLVYHPLSTDGMQLNQCWAILNLLKKFVEISPQVEAIGRYYYKQYSSAIISLIKVLDCDIQMLYKRIKNYICHRIRQYEVLFENSFFQNLQSQQQERMKELLQLIDELQIVNEYVRLLYVNKYFVDKLSSSQILQPVLYRPESNIDLLYHIKSQISGKWVYPRRSLFKNRKIDEFENLQDV